ncbi:MAG TPA: DUF2085 domain-containing protein [Anaerolineaceae bacterium]|jgi:uncharacterized membrane protein
MISRLEKFRWLLPSVTGMLLLLWLAETPPGLLGKADAIGYAVCHRIASHSFFLDGRQFPLCARCTGMYLGALLGLVYSFQKGHRAGFPPRRILVVLGVFVLGFGVDGVNSYLNLLSDIPFLYSSTNWLRLLTGTMFGLGVGIYLASAFKQAAWKEYENRPALANLRQLGILVVLGGVIDLAVLSGNPLLLYPLALLAAPTAVLMILTLAYTMLWVVVFKLDNTFVSWRTLWFSLVSGFSTALMQVIVIDVIRMAVTGTWAGFSL